MSEELRDAGRRVAEFVRANPARHDIDGDEWGLIRRNGVSLYTSDLALLSEGVGEREDYSVVERAIVPGKDEDSYGRWPDLSDLEARLSPAPTPEREAETAEKVIREAIETGADFYASWGAFWNADETDRAVESLSARLLAARQPEASPEEAADG